MRSLLQSACLAALALAAPAAAEAEFPPQLTKISGEDASLLIDKIAQAQAALRSGKPSLFRLQSGSIASYDKADVSPRDAFLALDFSKPWSVERLSSATSRRQQHLITILPEGPGPDKLVWKIEVGLEVSGAIATIAMMYEPVAPF
jgi:hypothetical protein